MRFPVSLVICCAAHPECTTGGAVVIWHCNIYVKTVSDNSFKGLPNRFLLVGFFTSPSYCFIQFGGCMLHLRLRYFGIEIAVLPEKR